MEIERKFLVKKIPLDPAAYPHSEIRQGYLSFEPEVRIRQIGDAYFLTEKGAGSLVREENEAEISGEEYRAKEPLVISAFIDKTRYLIPLDNGLVAELDIYHGKLDGLVAVEVEFESVASARVFTPPDWFGREITEDKKYRNKNLAKKTYKRLFY